MQGSTRSPRRIQGLLACTSARKLGRPMSDRPWRLPPDRAADALSVQDLWAVLGATPELLADPEAMRLMVLSTIEVLCDECRALHPGAPADARLRELFGVASLGEGSFASALRDLLQAGHPAWRGVSETYQMSVAATLANRVLNEGWLSHTLPSVNLIDDRLMFDGNQHQYDLPPLREPRIVVDYGPGLGIRFMLEEHFRACAAGRPFYYFPVTLGPFPNQFGLCYLTLAHGQEAVSEYLARRMTFGQEDGILATTTRLLTNMSGEVDVIFCSGLQDADKQELEAGIVNAFPLLRSGGTLLIRSQRHREPPESSTVGDMLAIAERAGFSAPRLFHSVGGDLLAAKRTAVVSAIFVKP